MNFVYIALNKNNQKIEGEVSAENLNIARDRLHGMGLSILSITEKKEEDFSITQEVKTEQAPKDYKSFEFKALDKKKKEIIGTIDADSEINAYFRLKDEFHFEVQSMFDLDASEMEKERQKVSLAEELEKKYQMYAASVPQEISQKRDDLNDFEEKTNQKLELLRNQVEIMIVQIKTLLKKIENDGAKAGDSARIETLIAELERIKMSNNITHIRSLAERILDMAESLFKEEEEFKVIIKQKKNLKQIDKLDKLYHQNAVDISNVTGVLNKLSILVKQYGKSLGIKEKPQNVLPKEDFMSAMNPKGLLEKDDFNEKPKEEIGITLSAELKKMLAFKQDASMRRVAFQNFKNLLPLYFRSSKKQKDSINKGEKTLGWSFLKFHKKVDTSQADFENIFREIEMFFSWLLFFYLIYFYVGGLVLQKNLMFLHNFFYKTITSEVILFFVLFVFVFSLLVKIKIKFFRQSFFGGVFLFFIGVLTVGMYVLNY